MGRAIGPHKAGLALGTLLGGWHLLWSVFVALGVAQIILDFIFWMHFIKPVYIVQPFNLPIAAVLIVATSALGYLVGCGFALVWNRLHGGAS